MSNARRSTQPGGGGRIVALMILFTIAIGFDVVVIAGLAAVGGWRMLAMAFGVHLFASAIVLVEVADVIAGRRRWQRHPNGR